MRKGDGSPLTYRWGVIGPGRFASEFVGELQHVERAQLAAVASRNSDRANSFAAEFGFERAYTEYEELFADPDVDLVYLPVPHVFHEELATRAIQAGKAVLCEKPLTADPVSTQRLIQFSRERKVFLMEAMKTGFLPAVMMAKRWLEEGRIGSPEILRANFCFLGSLDPKDRLMNPELGGGAILDVGIYPLYLALHLLGRIETIKSTGVVSETGVERSAVMGTQHEQGALASLTCSFASAESMDAVLLGQRGEIRLPRFHAARRAELWRDGRLIEAFEDELGAMVAAEIEAVHAALDQGLIECSGHPLDLSLRLSEAMETARSQILR